mgnify:FL=1
MGNARNIAFWVILFLLILVVINMFSNTQATRSSGQCSYSEFIQKVEAGEVTSVQLNGEQVSIQGKDGKFYSTIAPKDDTLTTRLIEKGVEVEAKAQADSGIFSLISLWLPFIVLIGFWIFFMNRMQGGG